MHGDFWTEVERRSGGGRAEAHGDFWTEVEGNSREIGPKCMEMSGRRSREVVA